jgi:hypothetical protein
MTRLIKDMTLDELTNYEMGLGISFPTKTIEIQIVKETISRKIQENDKKRQED